MQDFSNRRYEIEAEIGRGGMGIVYRALDRLVGQKIAIKRVGTSAEDLIYGSWTKSVDRRLSLAQEFQTLASLWHPNIIRVLDYGFDAENPPYFSMDLLEEPQRITDYGKTLPQEQKIHLIWQILLALKYLHRRGVLHRDLKPGNILVSKGEIKVLDFGLAVALNEKQKSNSTTSGTLAYMAPEVFSGLPASEASDLYAVGVIAFELLTGRHPFHVEDPAKLMHDLGYSVPEFSTFGETPLELVSIIQPLMLKPPDDRFHRTGEAIATFNQATNHPLHAQTN